MQVLDLIQLVDVIAEGSYVHKCAVMTELSRFHSFQPSELDELLFSRRAEGTKRVIKSSGDLFQEFLTVKGLTLEDLEYSNATIDDTVKEFFLTVKHKDGERYETKSLHH